VRKLHHLRKPHCIRFRVKHAGNTGTGEATYLRISLSQQIDPILPYIIHTHFYISVSPLLAFWSPTSLHHIHYSKKLSILGATLGPSTYCLFDLFPVYYIPLSSPKVLPPYQHRGVFFAFMQLKSGTRVEVLTKASKKLVRCSLLLTSACKHANMSFRSSHTTSSAHNPCRLHRLGGLMPSDR